MKFIIQNCILILLYSFLLFGCASHTINIADPANVYGELKYLVDKRPFGDTESTLLNAGMKIELLGDEFFNVPPMAAFDYQVGRTFGGKITDKSIEISKMRLMISFIGQRSNDNEMRYLGNGVVVSSAFSPGNSPHAHNSLYCQIEGKFNSGRLTINYESPFEYPGLTYVSYFEHAQLKIAMEKFVEYCFQQTIMQINSLI